MTDTDTAQDPEPPEGARRWGALALLSAGALLAMTTWFSATAITPELTRALHLSPAQASWLTGCVQLGFVVGALTISITGLSDAVPLPRLIGISALLAAGANACLLAAPSPAILLAARFATGIALAGVYPPTLKLASTWFRRQRGTALGALLAALSLGSASPHLFRAFPTSLAWQGVALTASAAAALGGVLVLAFGAEGPYPFNRTAFEPRHLASMLRNRPLALANLGYFGHMWELYAMWGWMLAYVGAGAPGLGLAGPRAVSLITFAVVASGVAGAVAGGVLADRIGRTATAAWMMTVSGLCAALIGLAFDGPLWLFLVIAAVWGASIIGDSAQFSAMATELSDPRTVGSALTLQMGIGFALTIVSIRLTGLLAEGFGWRWSFLLLVPGPIVGVTAMLLLRRMPEAKRIAHGLR